MKHLLSGGLAFSLLLATSVAWSQGLLVDTSNDDYRLPRPEILPPTRPRPTPVPASYKVKQLSVNANLSGQIAKVQVSQTFENTGSRQMEVVFVFPLPYDGAVDSLTFLVDGKEYPARLLSAKEARRIYEDYVRRHKDPALMEWIGNGMFKTSVFPVPAGAQRTVTLRYAQLCRKEHGLTDFLFPLSTAKYTSGLVGKVDIQATLHSDVPIKNVYSPTHEVKIERPSDKVARVVYHAEQTIPSSDFRLLYDISDQSVGASVLSYRPKADDEGYFLMLLSPEIRKADDEVSRKTVIFVVDRSGSMSGKKMEQTKSALRFVLNNLREEDRFNIIAYDSAVESFRLELQRIDETARKEALRYVEDLYAGGSTNIDGALHAALGQVADDKQPTYLIFLTDGLPTAGETNEARIVANAEKRNLQRARVFSFGVGYDVNSRLLDRLSRTCFGQSEYVRPNENIESGVSRLYARIGSPVLTDVAVNIDVEGLETEQGSAISRVYPAQIGDLFAGQQLVLVGRYRQPGAARITVTGTVGTTEQKLGFPAQLVDQSTDQTHAYIEKLWAMRRVGEIIDRIDLEGKNKELIDELVRLATRHGIITPYTSFLAEEDGAREDLAARSGRASGRWTGWRDSEGAAASS